MTEAMQASIGHRLQQARAKKSMSLELAATRLNLHIHSIEALESGHFDRISHPMFIRGYLRAYAKLLEIDATELVEQYNQLAPADPEIVSIYQSTIAANRSEHAIQPSAIALIALLLAVISILWWRHTADDQDPRAATDPARQERQTLAATKPPSPSATGAVVAPDNNTEPAAVTTATTPPRGADPATGAGRAMGPITIAQSNPVSALNGDVLIIQADSESWVEITAANGEPLLYGIVEAGRTRILQGPAPFRVFLDNMPGISIKLNGTSIRQLPYNPTTKISQFSLAADGSVQQ